jgi:hypothetical protein
MSSVRPVFEYGSACWDLFREGQINALDRVQKKVAQFTNHTKNSACVTLAQRRTIAPLYVLLLRTLRDVLGKLHETGSEGLTISIG